MVARYADRLRGGVIAVLRQMKKTSKASVSYQNEPRGDERCDKCTMFVKPNGCTLVMGHILPEGWCVEYQLKNNFPKGYGNFF